MRIGGIFKINKKLSKDFGLFSLGGIWFQFDPDNPYAKTFKPLTEYTNTTDEIFCEWDRSEWGYDPKTGECNFTCRAISLGDRYIDAEEEPWNSIEPWKALRPSECNLEVPEEIASDVDCFELTCLVVWDPWDDTIYYEFPEEALKEVTEYGTEY